MIRRVVSEMHDLKSGMTFRNTAQALPGLILAHPYTLKPKFRQAQTVVRTCQRNESGLDGGVLGWPRASLKCQPCFSRCFQPAC